MASWSRRSTRPGSPCEHRLAAAHHGRGRLLDRDARLGRRPPGARDVRLRVEIVGADGELSTVRRGRRGFAGAVVALGARGVT